MSLILVINPGSTSTKLSIFENLKELKTETLRHDSNELLKFKTIADQKNYRLQAIENFISKNNYHWKDFYCLAARGGLMKPIASGTYKINQTMYDDLLSTKYGEHASNLGGIIAYECMKKYHIDAYTVDPVVVDEMAEIAKITGSAIYQQRCIFHALNQKAVAKRYAKEINKPYESLNLIVAHVGGGATVGYHHCGKVVDVNNGLGGLGPYSPERAGGLPPFAIVDQCFDFNKTKAQVKKDIVGNGGLISYLGTSDVRMIETNAINGDSKSNFYIHGMAYQVSKEIGGLYFIANGKIDCIIITGGVAYSKLFIKYLNEYLKGLCEIKIYPGEDEMLALVEGVLRVINKEEQAKIY
jgi:butyrate kinase